MSLRSVLIKVVIIAIVICVLIHCSDARRRRQRRTGSHRGFESRRRSDRSRSAKVHEDPHKETIHAIQVTGSIFSRLLHPHNNHQPNIKLVRRERLYCRVGIGYQLEVRKDGKVTARHQSTKNGIFEVFSMKHGVVGIRSERHRRYVCMNKRGRVFTRRSFRHDCEFREELEANGYVTFASQLYSDHQWRLGYFLAMSKRGKPRRGKRVTWKMQSAHWLARTVTDKKSNT
uniref:Fibroblast growth factor n=1 Tax=Ciona intestinalis TaxID=7719 RepID=Q8I6J6_CIOIN|nr:fibroblast growth factor 4/5/6 [Ciona intestinalis]BAC22067.1 fibroblast growth factor 4/5/6 [Ciona intestinalis]|eukprot:NP_001027747.1 fibroblast growth factor 4/5/6 [Ciona intestinalis]